MPHKHGATGTSWAQTQSLLLPLFTTCWCWQRRLLEDPQVTETNKTQRVGQLLQTSLCWFISCRLTIMKKIRNTMQFVCSRIRQSTVEIWKQLLHRVTWFIDPSSFSTSCLTWCYLRPWLLVSKQTSCRSLHLATTVCPQIVMRHRINRPHIVLNTVPTPDSVLPPCYLLPLFTQASMFDISKVG